MKKVLLAFVASAFLFTACDETVDPVTVSLSSTEAIETTLQASPKMVKLEVTNSTSQSATINWELNKTSDPAGFTYMINGAAATSGTLEMAANEVKEIVLIVDPNNNAGTATGTLTFYDANNQLSTTKTFGYNVQTIAAYFKIEPVGLTSSSARAADPKDYYIDIIGLTSTPVTVTWVKEENIPAGWTVPICTDAACYAPTIFTQEVTVMTGDTVKFKATFEPKGTQGPGDINSFFYVASDSAATRVEQKLEHQAN